MGIGGHVPRFLFVIPGVPRDGDGLCCGDLAMRILGMEFSIHPRLAAGGFELGGIGGCRLLLKNNAMFPWFLLVPEVADGIEDLHQLEPDRYDEVMAAVRSVSEFVSRHFAPEKLNVACIGNQVRQMHIHIVGRSTGDPAWPGTVWAFDGKQAYSAGEVGGIREAAREFLELE
jgi:diadenosine tetraphosphate (Ap4A) HIT family hydrolase